MKNKKVFVFDFDGVFYSGEHKFENIRNAIAQNKRKFLPNLTDAQYDQICQNHPEWTQAVRGKNIVENIYKLKYIYPQYDISVDGFNNWQSNDIYKIIIDFGQVIDTKVMKKLCKNYAVYVVSNSSQNHIHFYMKKLGVNPKWFKKVISNMFVEEDTTKKHYLKEILDAEKCLPQNAYMFGDTDESDLVPARKLGMNDIFVENSNDIPKYLEQILGKKL